jgi:4-hydroxy-tetrahydrodipicolinate reductase
MIRVIVHGAAGNVGREVMRALCSDAELEAVGAVDLKARQDRLPLPDGSGDVPYSTELESIIVKAKPDVMVDFSIKEASVAAIRIAARHGVNMVIGTTGFSAADIDEFSKLSQEAGIGMVVAPNFSIGAVLMIHLSRLAARYFDYAEVIEKHHEKKADAPSGTALSTAQAMAESRGKPFSSPPLKKETLAGTRGGQIQGISVHSVRLPGLLAHQEVMFGALGQTLTIRHDTISREAFMPGVVMAIKHVVRVKGLTHGLENLLEL